MDASRLRALPLLLRWGRRTELAARTGGEGGNMASTVLARHAALRNRYVKKSGPQNKLSRLKEKGRRRAARRRRRAAAGEKRPHPPDPAKKSGPLSGGKRWGAGV